MITFFLHYMTPIFFFPLSFLFKYQIMLDINTCEQTSYPLNNGPGLPLQELSDTNNGTKKK